MKHLKIVTAVMLSALAGSALAAQAPTLQNLQQETVKIAHTPDAQQREALLKVYLQDMQSYTEQTRKMMSSMKM